MTDATTLDAPSVTTGGNKVLILGGGLAGLAAAKRLVDNGFQVQLVEKRDIFGGKVSAWKDAEGDWVETGLHCFFGAYSELYDLMREIGTYDCILWKKHELNYTLSKGERFAFRTWDLPSPFHLTPALFANGYFSLPEMLAFAKVLIPILFGGERYYEAQDGMTYKEWHERQGLSERMMKKMFLPMSLALKFLPPAEISANIVLAVTGEFLRRPDASMMGFLKGSPEDYLIGPLVNYLRKKGATIQSGRKALSLIYDGNRIAGAKMDDGETLVADYYLTALPVHNLKKVLPENLKRAHQFFRDIDEFVGVPVVTVQVWYDRQITTIDNILFSPDGVIPFYADLALTTPEYAVLRGASHQGKTRFQVGVAPAKEVIKLSDEEIVARVDASVKDLFPETAKDAKILKHAIVRIPQSVYAPYPGLESKRPTQKTPVDNLFIAGGYTKNRFYDSMEGAVSTGNSAARELMIRHGVKI
ncbi:MAG: FAD-dependent oxidoreductase [Chloroherpetonaceae bacterium]|nr:FAD-dependent oxidoreductase [Chloroherpetonaceae bacterium]MDW8438482.1 FAD-dependent oxidoreductase [Chloroherpetonaceae bacterium]